MKKVFVILICAIMCTAILASCDIFKHEHTKSDWRYSEIEHWRVPECNRKNCVLEDEVYDFGQHVDENDDNACDVCGYEYVLIFKQTANK